MKFSFYVYFSFLIVVLSSSQWWWGDGGVFLYTFFYLFYCQPKMVRSWGSRGIRIVNKKKWKKIQQNAREKKINSWNVPKIFKNRFETRKVHSFKFYNTHTDDDFYTNANPIKEKTKKNFSSFIPSHSLSLSLNRLLLVEKLQETAQ